MRHHDDIEKPSGDVTIMVVLCPLDVLSLVVFCVTFSLAAPSNAVALCVFIRELRRKPTPNVIYMINLSISDGIFTVLLLLKMVETVWGQWALPEVFCPIYNALYLGIIYTSILFLTVLAMGRYLSVAFPIRYAAYKSPHYSQVICVILWLTAAAHIYLIFLMENRDLQDTKICCANNASISCANNISSSSANNASICCANNTLICCATNTSTSCANNASVACANLSQSQVDTMLRLEPTVVLFLVPLVLTCLAYLGCFRKLRRSGLPSREKHRALRATAATLAVFVACYTPFNAAQLVGSTFGVSMSWRREALLAAAPSAFLNPLVVFCSSSALQWSAAEGWRAVAGHLRDGWLRLWHGAIPRRKEANGDLMRAPVPVQ
ncbi:free fatty acid receptor 1-like [Rhincodon typus]|uniref:free fatty acid receptor 1-like n=1 Tax=Rhincodon typus TaxID=259920 RepID=UPI00202FC164|nr:free fatty acid receptor 1-like [Rhincodon typus]